MEGKDYRLGPLLAAFAEVSCLIAEQEPLWEKRRVKICRDKAEAPMTWLVAAKGQVEATAAAILHPPGRRGRALKISVKEAAAAFQVSAGTIKNWDRGRSRPPQYPGRDVESARFEACAGEYLLQRVGKCGG